MHDAKRTCCRHVMCTNQAPRRETFAPCIVQKETYLQLRGVHKWSCQERSLYHTWRKGQTLQPKGYANEAVKAMEFVSHMAQMSNFGAPIKPRREEFAPHKKLRYPPAAMRGVQMELSREMDYISGRSYLPRVYQGRFSKNY